MSDRFVHWENFLYSAVCSASSVQGIPPEPPSPSPSALQPHLCSRSRFLTPEPRVPFPAAHPLHLNACRYLRHVPHRSICLPYKSTTLLYSSPFSEDVRVILNSSYSSHSVTVPEGVYAVTD